MYKIVNKGIGLILREDCKQKHFNVKNKTKNSHFLQNCLIISLDRNSNASMHHVCSVFQGIKTYNIYFRPNVSGVTLIVNNNI